MRFTITVDVDLTRRQKRMAGAGLAAAVALSAGIALAAPKTFVAGETLKAADLNASFGELDGRTSALEATGLQQTADGEYSIGATACGATVSTTGDLSGLTGAAGTGYAKARAACQTTCGSPSAHMCHSDEVVRSMQLGELVDNGWYSTGAHSQFGAETVSECASWESADPVTLGAVWSNGVSVDHCNQSWPVVCCD